MSVDGRQEEIGRDEHSLLLEQVRSRKQAPPPILEELQELAAKVLPARRRTSRANVLGRGGISARYPHKDTSAGRNCKIVFWDEEIRHLEYSPQTRTKSHTIRSVDIWDVIGHSESFQTIDPLRLVTLKEDINDRLAREGAAWRLV